MPFELAFLIHVKPWTVKTAFEELSEYMKGLNGRVKPPFCLAILSDSLMVGYSNGKMRAPRSLLIFFWQINSFTRSYRLVQPKSFEPNNGKKASGENTGNN